MKRVFNIIMFLLVLLFIFSIYEYYSSSKNINSNYFNRNNVEKILKTKIYDLPVLNNDTNNIIEFNDSFETEINNNKKRSFWDLLNKKR